MALTSLKKKPDADVIQASLSEYASLSGQETSLQQEYDEALEAIALANPHVCTVRNKLQACQARVSAVKSSITDMVRITQSTVKVGNAGVHYSNPVSISYDLSVLEHVYPEASNIPNLIKKSIDVEIAEAAIAAGHLPEWAALRARVETPKYSDGRVQIRVYQRSEF
jgi:electron transfer flavoprotein alpha/beta subunit